jgi:hypothetical protein
MKGRAHSNLAKRTHREAQAAGDNPAGHVLTPASWASLATRCTTADNKRADRGRPEAKCSTDGTASACQDSKQAFHRSIQPNTEQDRNESLSHTPANTVLGC